MVWEPTQFRYPRPIRWIAALFGSDVVSFSVAGVRSARWTLGLGPWAPKKIPLPQAGKYALSLKNECVMVDPVARQETIRRFADQAVKRLPTGQAGVHGRIHYSAALLEQVANLVEHPVAILGNFEPAYLDLPKEVLITCLEHHQKFFPVLVPHPNPLPKGEGADRPGEAKLLPFFVGIRNGVSVHQEVVREGYERVLSARLADARFFFNQDRKTALASKVDALKGIMFQQKLGNLFDKKERVKQLLETFSSTMGGFEGLEKAKRVADLCKADLVTDMVREFPELQGIMARLYAKADGENAIVSQALEEQYWPITLTGALPTSDVAALVALADKLDTLAGDFAVGLIPTGSADPYGLRRAAVGVLRILEDRSWNLNLEQLIDQAVRLQPVQHNAEETKAKLLQFFRQRLSAILEERDFKVDEIEAILESGIGVVPDSLARLKSLQGVRSNDQFKSLAASHKRVKNILRQSNMSEPATDRQPQVELLKEEAEQQLFAILQKVQLEVAQHAEHKSYKESLLSMVVLSEPLANFFSKVMVMAEDPTLKTNRIKLMYRVAQVFDTVADFSKLQNG